MRRWSIIFAVAAGLIAVAAAASPVRAFVPAQPKMVNLAGASGIIEVNAQFTKDDLLAGIEAVKSDGMGVEDLRGKPART